MRECCRCLVCNGADRGIDPHYCDSGMFGRAAYFAELTEYSDSGTYCVLLLSSNPVCVCVCVTPSHSISSFTSLLSVSHCPIFAFSPCWCWRGIVQPGYKHVPTTRDTSVTYLPPPRSALGQTLAQVLLCRVAAGRVEERVADGSIRHPTYPHHSIRGKVRDPAFFAIMVYETRQSYPAYVVSYYR